jgi:hypothetical protein
LMISKKSNNRAFKVELYCRGNFRSLLGLIDLVNPTPDWDARKLVVQGDCDAAVLGRFNGVLTSTNLVHEQALA